VVYKSYSEGARILCNGAASWNDGKSGIPGGRGAYYEGGLSGDFLAESHVICRHGHDFGDDISQLSRGNNMRPSKTKKNRTVCKRRPIGVGQPAFEVVNMEPNTICVTL
jgi:hypothetical protein